MSRVLELWTGMTGTVLPYALATAPGGWMICDGAALTPGLADILRQKLIADGNPYGTSGSDPRLPDLRGEFIRGLDNGRGIDTGRALGTAQADQIKAHTHTEQRALTAVAVATGASATVLATQDTVNTGSTGGPETRPRNVAMNHIIKT